MTVSSLLLSKSNITTSSKSQAEKKEQIRDNVLTAAAQTVASQQNSNIFSSSSANVVEKESSFDRSGIDISSLVKKYKKNPSAIFDEIGLDFTDKQKTELKKYVTDKKSLESFLQFVQKENLTESDIVSAMVEYTNLKNSQKGGISGWFQRVKNTVKTAFKEGVSEAVDYAKSESVYLAAKAGANMDEIREIRKDVSSENVAYIGYGLVENEDLKEDAMHFVTKTDTEGYCIYQEETVVKAYDYMLENGKEKADEFTANAVELECITTPEGTVKYQGDTIVDTSIKVTDQPEIKEAAMSVAYKSDTTDESLSHITDNLSQNPDMADTVEFEATAKNEDGTDKFTSDNICDSTDYLVDKDKETCDNYTTDMKQMAENPNLSGSDIVEINRTIQDNPSYRTEILARACNSSNSGSNIVNECKNYVAQAKTEKSTQSTTNTEFVSNIDNNGNSKAVLSAAKESSVSNPIASNDSARKVTVDGKKYNRAEILKDISKNFGSSNAELILQTLERNQKAVQLLKQYGNKRELREAIASDPSIISKLQKVSTSITISDLAEMIQLCKNVKTTDALIKLSELISPQKAMVYLKSPGTADKILPVLDNSILKKSQKMEIINNITGR